MTSFLKNFRGIIALSALIMAIVFAAPVDQNLPPDSVTSSVSPPKILSVSLSTNGAVQMGIIGQAQHHFVVETSTDLNSWSALTTNVFSAVGEGSFMDTNMHNTDITFYRVLQLENITGVSSTN